MTIVFKEGGWFIELHSHGAILSCAYCYDMDSDGTVALNISLKRHNGYNYRHYYTCKTEPPSLKMIKLYKAFKFFRGMSC